MNVHKLACEADNNNHTMNCLAASTSVIIRLLVSQYTIPVLKSNPDIAYINTYNHETHKELYEHFHVLESNQRNFGQNLDEMTFIPKLFPLDYVYYSGNSIKEEFHKNIRNSLDHPENITEFHSNLRVINFQISETKPNVKPLYNHGNWQLVAMLCIEPQHFVSYILFKGLWYKFTNWPTVQFDQIEPLRTIPFKNGDANFSATLFYVREQTPEEPICTLLQTQMVKSHTIRQKIPNKYRPTVQPGPDDLWNYFEQYPNDNDDHVIVSEDQHLFNSCTLIKNPRKGKLYKTYIFNRNKVIPPSREFPHSLIPCAYKRYIGYSSHTDNVCFAINNLQQSQNFVVVIPNAIILQPPEKSSSRHRRRTNTKKNFDPHGHEVIDLDSDDDDKPSGPVAQPKSSSGSSHHSRESRKESRPQPSSGSSHHSRELKKETSSGSSHHSRESKPHPSSGSRESKKETRRKTRKGTGTAPNPENVIDLTQDEFDITQETFDEPDSDTSRHSSRTAKRSKNSSKSSSSISSNADLGKINSRFKPSRVASSRSPGLTPSLPTVSPASHHQDDDSATEIEE